MKVVCAEAPKANTKPRRKQKRRVFVMLAQFTDSIAGDQPFSDWLEDDEYPVETYFRNKKMGAALHDDCTISRPSTQSWRCTFVLVQAVQSC